MHRRQRNAGLMQKHQLFVDSQSTSARLPFARLKACKNFGKTGKITLSLPPVQDLS
ncbi:MAG: hypothetical protein V7K54_30415 [Nostoc sp.]